MIASVIDVMREGGRLPRRVVSSGSAAHISREPLDSAHFVDYLALFDIVNRVVEA